MNPLHRVDRVVAPAPNPAGTVEPAETSLPAPPGSPPSTAAAADARVALDVAFSAVAVVSAAEAAALELSPAQRTAIIKLTAGHTRAEAALAAGVSRMTLYRWLGHDSAFQAAFNTWQNDVLATAQAQLLACTHDAVATVLHAIRHGDARLAWKLLDSHGVTRRPSAGSTDFEEIERRQTLARQKEELAERKERNAVQMEELMNPEGF